MEHLRLLDSNYKNEEFYSNDLQALFLGGIKPLNIIIGANNSRKSRFLRKIIATERKLIVKTPTDLNKIVQQKNEIEEACKPYKGLFEMHLIEFEFTSPQYSNEKYINISNVFNKKNQGTALSLMSIQILISNITDLLFTSATQDDTKKIKKLISEAYDAIELIYDTYIRLNKVIGRHNDLGTKRPSLLNSGIRYSIPGASYQIPEIKVKLDILKKAFDKIQLYHDVVPTLHDVPMIYIPVLRTSRRLLRAENKEFENTLMNQYKMEPNSKLTLETGLDLYEKIDAKRNGLLPLRENFTDFENFISEAFFQGKRIEIVAVRDETNSANLRISIEGEIPDVLIHDLGDGIQGIINLLFPVFTAAENTWIFIDEPENHLHPGYQNLFIRTISDHPKIREKNLRFFINTHSNHILTEGMLGGTETEILVFSRRDKDSSDILTFAGNEYHTLEMLGVFNTSVLISNCSIWVEGVTDRLYMRAFLQAYWKEQGTLVPPTEGLNYSFMEYAGNNIVHYNFDHGLKTEDPEVGKQIKAFFLHSKIFLLADSDFAKDRRHAFYEDISAKRDNFQYFKTELPEIENLLPDEILKNWLINSLKCDATEVEKRFESKASKIKLGQYLDQHFSKGDKKRRFMKDKEGGTLRSDLKASLCDFFYNGVLNNTISWNQLQRTPILKELVEQANAFIHAANKK